MKISQKLQSQSIKQPQLHRKSSHSFEQIVQTKVAHLQQEEMEHVIKEITIQGERLARSRTFQDLVAFKRLVKEFLQKTVYNGLELKTSHHFSFDGHSQKLAIVEEIDKKLVALTEEVLNQEKKSVDLLGLIGEIKGLLINLYT